MFRIKGKSIMFKILVMILTICVLESLIFTIMSEYMTVNTLEKIITENSRKNAELYSDYIGSWLMERMQEIEMYANTPLVKSMDWDIIEPYLKNEIEEKLPVYDHFMVADLNGYYSNTLKRNAGNAIDREYFKAATEGKILVSNPIISRTNGKPVTIVAAPIRSDTLAIRGVMAGSINLVKLSKIIENLKYNYPDSYSYIIDKNGLILAHPVVELILNENITEKSDIVTEQMAESTRDMLSMDEGAFSSTYGNESSMNYYHVIPNTDGWRLIIKIPADYWLIPIRYSSMNHILIGLAGLVIASILGFFVAKSISRPIVLMKELFMRAASGDLSARSEIAADDEIGDAARSFNKMMDNIISLTYYDPLTLLPNRMLFNASLDVELEKASRDNSSLAVMIFDIDKFESINNTLGHTAGDKLLKNLAERIGFLTEQGCTVCHMGEDRFAILFKGFADKDDALRLADEIRDVIRQPWLIDEHRFYITACSGMAFYPEDGESSNALFKNAFSAMQKAKRKGRDNYAVYDPSMNSRLLEQLNLDSSMHHALDNGEFSLFYQPQVDASTGELVGCEALLRWNHPELGMISPLKFIPVAEANGLIIPIGRWVLYTACIQNRLWHEAGHKPFCVSVNLSAVQLIQEDFIEMISNTIRETGISPECLELEITESVAVKNPEYITAIIEQLKRMGIRIALDDFGTGYSSLNYLKNFAITTLKIDRSFICDINENPKNSAIVSSILAMGHNLMLKVTAEGVETVEQYETLRERGCDVIQGFYFSKPLPLYEFEKLWLKY
ncbi:MAG TPA: EAL domain-containing protein [Clostridia bacterium]|nr:EAL domain-containing protein [Clostridia bacterium]